MRRQPDRGVQDAPSSTPERTALALAMEKAHAARRTRDNAAAAEGPARSAVYAARERIEDAEAAIEASKVEAGRQAVEAFAAGNTAEAPLVLRRARAALVEAEDDLAVAIAARDGLDGRRMADAAAVNDAERDLKLAVSAVIRSEVKPSPEELGKEIVELQRQLADKANALEYLIAIAGALERVTEPGSMFGELADVELRNAIMRTRTGYQPLHEYQWEALKAASPSHLALAAAAAALERDPAATVPKIG